MVVGLAARTLGKSKRLSSSPAVCWSQCWAATTTEQWSRPRRLFPHSSTTHAVLHLLLQ